MNRRDVLSAVAVGVPALTMAAAGENKASAAPKADKEAAGAAPAFAGKHAPVPLPFAPGKLTGISEKMIVSHHDNNYTARDQEPEQGRGAARRHQQGHPGVPGRGPQGARADLHELDDPARALLREPRAATASPAARSSRSSRPATEASAVGGALPRPRAQPRRRKRLGHRRLQPPRAGMSAPIGPATTRRPWPADCRCS